MKATGSLFVLLRQRLPFLSLLLLAICGIGFSEYLQAASLLGIMAAIFLGAAFLATRRSWAFGGFVVCVFATLHAWRSYESQAAEFAKWLGRASVQAEAHGIVASEPRVFTGRSRFEMRLSALHVDGVQLAASFLLLVEVPGPAPAYGDEVRVRGTLQKIEGPRNPGEFNFAAWSQRRGIFTLLSADHQEDEEILQTGQGNPLVTFALWTRGWLRQTLTEGVNDPSVSELLVAMVLGDVSSLPQQIEEEFRGTGTFHLFSVSGLHVGMVCILLWYLFKVLRISRQHAAGWIIPLLLFYVLMTGLKAASLRSALMAAIVLLGLMAERRPLLFNNLCAAGFLILLADTHQLMNPGFQLSFCVVAAIMLLARPMASWLSAPFLPDPFLPQRLLSTPRRWVARCGEQFASLAAVSTAAWLGSLPLTICYFHLVSLTALPTNLLAVPISFAIMAVAMLSFTTGLFSIWIASIYNQTNWLLTKLLLAIVHVFASLPGSFFYVKLPESPTPIAEIVVFDFGAGGAAWISASGSDWLIDSGPAYSHDFVLLPFLRSRGLRALDGFLITHGDAGHIGSAAQLIRTCPPRRIVGSTLDDRSVSRTRLHSELSLLGISKSPHRSGDWIGLDAETRLQILYPPGEIPQGMADDKGLVFQLRAGSTRILFMSDAGLYTEQWLVKNALHELQSDILIKGSPRQGPSGDSGFLGAVGPKAVIATAAHFPESEKIPARFAEILKERGIRLFAQDRCGAVVIRIFSGHWEISAFVDKQQYCHLR